MQSLMDMGADALVIGSADISALLPKNQLPQDVFPKILDACDLLVAATLQTMQGNY